MKRALLLAIPLVALSVLTLAAQQPRAAVVARHTWMVNGVERSALVASPSAPAPRTGAPLVLIFHGHGGTSLNSSRTFAIHTHWPEAVVIYPQGLATPGRVVDPEGLRPGWQQAAGDQSDRDLKLVDEMLKWARAAFTIDPARVYAGGHSNGGSMTYLLWATRGDQFAAFAPSASVFRRDLITAATPKPALIIAGEHDELVPFAAQALGIEATLRLNRAEQTASPWSGLAKLHKSAIGADVVTYIHPGTHAMPADAGAMMAKFFKEH